MGRITNLWGLSVRRGSLEKSVVDLSRSVISFSTFLTPPSSPPGPGRPKSSPPTMAPSSWSSPNIHEWESADNLLYPSKWIWNVFKLYIQQFLWALWWEVSNAMNRTKLTRNINSVIYWICSKLHILENNLYSFYNHPESRKDRPPLKIQVWYTQIGVKIIPKYSYPRAPRP